MNVIEVDFEEFGEILDMSKVLETWTMPMGGTLIVAEYAGSDWMFFSDPMSGGALLVDSNDEAYGGSTHQHIRDARNLGTY